MQIEATAFIGSHALFMMISDPRTGVMAALLIAAAVIDFRTHKIPNWLTMGGTAFSLIYAAVIPFPTQHGFLWALGGFALGFLIMLPLHALRVMGAGDVKLMAMAGAFLGVSDTLYAVITTFIVGGAAALGFAMYHRVLGRMLGNIKAVTQLMMLSAITGVRGGASIEASKSVGKLPYGVSIGVGTIGYVVARQLGYL